MENFVIDTTSKVCSSPYGDSYIHLYLKEGEINYELKCDNGRETDMAILLAALAREECYFLIMNGVSKLDNGEQILDEHTIVMDTLDEVYENTDEDDEEEYGDLNLSPLVHPIALFSSDSNDLFGDE